MFLIMEFREMICNHTSQNTMVFSKININEITSLLDIIAIEQIESSNSKAYGSSIFSLKIYAAS